MFRILGTVCHTSLLVQRKIVFTSSVSYSLDIILQTTFPRRLISEVNRLIWHTYIHTWMHTRSQYSQLKMPGGGCSVTSRQFSSSLLSPQSFCWLQISEPRYKHLPLAQVNLHSERQKRNQNKNLWENWCLPFFSAKMTIFFQVDAVMVDGSLAFQHQNKQYCTYSIACVNIYMTHSWSPESNH